MLILRKATIEDAQALFKWRNDPETRQASHNTGALSFDSHLAWLKASLSNPMRLLLIAEEDGTAVGQVRVDHEPGEIAELSWTVAPEARGRGIAKLMVQMAVDNLVATRSVRAEIKDGNEASVRVAEAAGLTLSRQEHGVLHFFRNAGVKDGSA